MKTSLKIPLLCLGALVLLAVATSVNTFAEEDGRQRRGGGFRRMGRMLGKVALLTSDQVREELTMTAEQSKAIDEILSASREEMRDLRGPRGGKGAKQGEGDDRKKGRQERRKKFAELRKSVESKVAAQLDTSQNERLDQIAMQQRGVGALTSGGVSSALALTEDQLTKIRDALDKQRKEMESLRPTRRERRGRREGRPEGRREKRREGRPEGRREKRREGRPEGRRGEQRKAAEKIRKSTRDAVMAVLSEEQARKFEELKGKPFKLDRRSLFSGRGERDGRGKRDGRGPGKRDGRGGDEQKNKERKGPDPDESI